MKEIVIQPRRRPVVIWSAILAILLGIFIWLASSADSRGMLYFLLVMIAADAAFLVLIWTGMIRNRLVFNEEGISSTTSAFAKKRTYRWNETGVCFHSENYYSLYTKDQEWIGSFDVRSPQAEEALEFLRKKKIPVRKEK